MAAIKFTKARNRAWEQYQEKLRQNKPLEKMIRKKSIDKNAKQEMKQELRDRQAMAENQYQEAIAQIEKHEKHLTPQIKPRSKEETERRRRITQECMRRISAWTGRGQYGELIAADCVREFAQFCRQTTHPVMRSYIDAQLLIKEIEDGVINTPGFWGYSNGGYEAVNIDIYAAAPNICIIQERITRCPKRDYFANTKKTYYLVGFSADGEEVFYPELTGQFVHAAIDRDNAPAAPILATLRRFIAENRNDLPLDFWAREAEREPRPTWARVQEKIRTRQVPTQVLDGVFDLTTIRDRLTFGIEIEGEQVIVPCGSPYKKHKEHCGEEADSYIFTFSKWQNGAKASTRKIIESSQPARNAGIHVHVGIMNLFNRPTEIRKTLVRLVTVWDAIEDDIAEIADRNHDRIRFCRKWNSAYVVDAYDALTNGRCSKKALKSIDKTPNKYKTLNLKALKEHGTVEFRLWNSSTDWVYVENAVTISTGVVAYAIATRDSNEDIYNYETTYDDFAVFLEKWRSLISEAC